MNTSVPGTGFTVFGFANASDSSASDPLLCYLDGSPISDIAGTTSHPATALCGVSNLTDETHEVVVKTPQGMLYLDYAAYIPSPTASLADAVILIPNDDANLAYSGIWSPEVADLPGPMTFTYGSQLTFPFYGSCT